MCHYCGAELTQSEEKTCKVCAEKQERESVKQGKAILYAVQMITPTSSLSGSDTSVSSCSEFSVDVSSCDRVNQEENTLCSSKTDVSNQSNGRLQNSSFEHPVNGLDNVYTVNVEIIQTSDDHEAKDSNENEDSENNCLLLSSVCHCSQLVKGLVFKKHAAHKLMPTKYKNPRLLLSQGSTWSVFRWIVIL